MIADLRVMNYYPATGGWNKMWTDWQPSVIDRNFAEIHALGANAVRIIVFPATFGWPTVSSIMATRFADALAIAAANGLGVQLTLFDRWASYDEVTQSQQWLQSLLQLYSADPEIRLVELKNEVDPSDLRQVAWLKALLPSLRSVLPTTPITVSVTGTDAPSEFVQLRSELDGAPLDVADMHFYGDERSAYSWMLKAKQAAGSLPLFVGEIGYPVDAGPGGLAAAEMSQAHWFDVVFAAARAADVPVPAPWTFTDFEPGAIPGRTESTEQYHFGLYATSGRPRPVVSVVRNAYMGKGSDTSNLNFELEGKDGLPMVWSTYLPSQGALGYAPKAGYVDPGSVRLSGTRLTSLGAPAFYLVPATPAISGQLWTVGVWAKGIDVNGNALVALSWYNSNGSYLGENSTSLPYGNTGWTRLVVSARVPSGATGVQINLQANNVSGTVWFNAVSILVGS